MDGIGITAPWYHGSVVDVMVLWHVPWYHGTHYGMGIAAPWYRGADMIGWNRYHSTMLSWFHALYHGTMVARFNDAYDAMGIIATWYQGTMMLVPWYIYDRTGREK